MAQKGLAPLEAWTESLDAPKSWGAVYVHRSPSSPAFNFEPSNAAVGQEAGLEGTEFWVSCRPFNSWGGGFMSKLPEPLVESMVGHGNSQHCQYS